MKIKNTLICLCKFGIQFRICWQFIDKSTLLRFIKKIRGFYDDTMIKVITGIRRCGKSYFLKSIIEELITRGVKEKDIINIELDKKEYKNITKPKELEELIDKMVTDDDFKYLFIDEVENVKDFEKVINAYREEDRFSIFLTGSNSYLLSGELATKLTGRYIEIEMSMNMLI